MGNGLIKTFHFEDTSLDVNCCIYLVPKNSLSEDTIDGIETYCCCFLRKKKPN